MKLMIETLSHPLPRLYGELPPGFGSARLPGSNVLSAHGSFGSMCFQEFEGDSFLLRYSVLKLQEPLVLATQSLFSGVHASIVLQTGIRPVIDGIGEVAVGEGQFMILQADHPKAVIALEDKRPYTFFEAVISASMAEEVLQDFPQLHMPLEKASPSTPRLWVQPPDWTPSETNNLVGNILRYPGAPAFRQAYFNKKVRDIFFDLLVKASHPQPIHSPISEAEMAKVLATEAAILSDLSRHETIRELAKKAMTSESRLKTLFKMLIGMGIHEYRIEQRLQRAIDLVHEGMYIKEVAALTGWSVGRLIVAYKKKYGVTPGVMRRKGK